MGFRLGNVSRVVSTRTTDGRSSFLEVVIGAINDQRPDLLDLDADLQDVRTAAKIDVTAVLDNFTELKNDLGEVVRSIVHEDLHQLREHLTMFIQVC